MTANDVVVIVDDASALGTTKATAPLLAKLTDITSDMSKPLMIGVDDGRRISGKKKDG